MTTNTIQDPLLPLEEFEYLGENLIKGHSLIMP